MRLRKRERPVQLAADLVRAATADDGEAVVAVLNRVAARNDAAEVLALTAEIAAILARGFARLTGERPDELAARLVNSVKGT